MGLLAIESTMSPQEALGRLQVNALAVHQRSMGRGDELVRILAQTIAQLEKSHRRVQTMSTVLFVAGLAVLTAGVVGVLVGRAEILSALIGGLGGSAALVAAFWSAPIERISTSVNDLVKVEAAFLGYIRVIGEIDSFFQMQYLDIITGTGNGTGKGSLAQAIQNTTGQMKDMMSHTVQLIDSHVSAPSDSLSEVKKELALTGERLRRLEASASFPQ